jgi:hypothetical protein
LRPGRAGYEACREQHAGSKRYSEGLLHSFLSQIKLLCKKRSRTLFPLTRG